MGITMCIDDMRQEVIAALTEHPQDFDGEDIGVLYGVVTGRISCSTFDIVRADLGLTVDVAAERVTLED